MKTTLRRNPLLLLALAVSALGSGCATLTRSSTEQVVIQSEPAGATVRLSTGVSGITPISFLVRRTDDLALAISLDGYEPMQILLPAKISTAGGAGATAGNFVLGGPIGGLVFAAIDVASGAALSHTPNPLNVVLKPVVSSPAPAAAPTMAVAERASP